MTSAQNTAGAGPKTRFSPEPLTGRTEPASVSSPMIEVEQVTKSFGPAVMLDHVEAGEDVLRRQAAPARHRCQPGRTTWSRRRRTIREVGTRSARLLYTSASRDARLEEDVGCLAL